MIEPIIVSACLIGFPCRYNGGTNTCAPLRQLYEQGLALPVCPESLSGLPVPRPPCEQRGDRVFSESGDDVTEAFQRGATAAFACARVTGCRKAVLKARSPSCGVSRIYDGSFNRALISGNGVFAQMLLDARWEVLDENQFLAQICVKK